MRQLIRSACVWALRITAGIFVLCIVLVLKQQMDLAEAYKSHDERTDFFGKNWVSRAELFAEESISQSERNVLDWCGRIRDSRQYAGKLHQSLLQDSTFMRYFSLCPAEAMRAELSSRTTISDHDDDGKELKQPRMYESHVCRHLNIPYRTGTGYVFFGDSEVDGRLARHIRSVEADGQVIDLIDSGTAYIELPEHAITYFQAAIVFKVENWQLVAIRLLHSGGDRCLYGHIPARYVLQEDRETLSKDKIPLQMRTLWRSLQATLDYWHANQASLRDNVRRSYYKDGRILW